MEMLQDILKTFPCIHHVHLRGDETVHAGTCRLCKPYVAHHGAASLYRTQIDPLITLLKKRSVRPIVWHDALITWTPAQLRDFGTTTDGMLWIYNQRTWTCNEWHPKIPTADFLTKFLREKVVLWGDGIYRCRGE